ncbi:hypothetical protein [Aurantibacillus circumpalustris]|uniref:hypothetical protein n=1 Tax=Aurantibacillus circumpalustris TaxID=3036359 RepID=UPI00295A9B49|nr:hypothetical protein [Aurantibacillus circumpalustris]
MKHKIIFFILAISVLMCLPFCKRPSERLPLVTTSVVSPEITEAYCSGVLYNEGDSKIIEKGICWGTKGNVSITDNKVISNTEGKTFTAKLEGLESVSTYYARAYATNAFGTSYGKVVSFNTWGVTAPNISLSAISNFNYVDLTLTVNQTQPSSYTTGICWSKSSLPTVSDNTITVSQRKFSDPFPYNKSYTLSIQDLDQTTIYNARAYVATNFGIAYSNQFSWVTSNPVSFSILSLGSANASFQVYVSGNNLSSIKTMGICWSEDPTPTETDYRIERAYTNTISNNFSISPLKSNTTYFLRSYVKTDTKTIYGAEEKMIRTL